MEKTETENLKWIYDQEMGYYVHTDEETYNAIVASNEAFFARKREERESSSGKKGTSWWDGLKEKYYYSETYKEESKSWSKSPSKFWSSRFDTTYWGEGDGSYRKIEDMKFAARTVYTIPEKHQAPEGFGNLVLKEKNDENGASSQGKGVVFVNLNRKGESAKDALVGEALSGVCFFRANKVKEINALLQDKIYISCDPKTPLLPVPSPLKKITATKSLASALEAVEDDGPRSPYEYHKTLVKSEVERRALQYGLEDSPGFEPYVQIYHADEIANVDRSVRKLHEKCSKMAAENPAEKGAGFWPVAVAILSASNRMFSSEENINSMSLMSQNFNIDPEDIVQAASQINDDYGDGKLDMKALVGGSFKAIDYLKEKYPFDHEPPKYEDPMGECTKILPGGSGGRPKNWSSGEDEDGEPAKGVEVDVSSAAEVFLPSHLVLKFKSFGHCVSKDHGAIDPQARYAKILSLPKVVELKRRIAKKAHSLYSEKTNKLKSLKSGDLDDGSLDTTRTSGDPAIFEQKEIIGKSSISIGLLVDASGSMVHNFNGFGAGTSNAEAATYIATAIYEALIDFKRVGVDVYTGWHTADGPPLGHANMVTNKGEEYDVAVRKYCKLGYPTVSTVLCGGFTESNAGIACAMAQSNNADGYAIEDFWEAMRRQNRKSHRVIFVLSDGYPACSLYDRNSDFSGIQHVKNVVDKIRKRGDEVISVNIGSADIKFERMYGKSNCVHATNEAALTGVFVAGIYRKIKAHIERSNR